MLRERTVPASGLAWIGARVHRGATPIGQVPQVPQVPQTSQSPQVRQIVVFGALIILGGWGSLYAVVPGSAVPAIWPSCGIVTGVLLWIPVARQRALVVALSFCSILVAHLVRGFSVDLALGFSITRILAIWVTHRLLVRNLKHARAGLYDKGDVSRLIGAIAGSSLVAAGGYALTAYAHGGSFDDAGRLTLIAAAAFGANAAALIVVVPLFLRTPSFAPLATTRERGIQLALTLGTTLVLLLVPSLPLIAFAIMPMFGWYAFRGTLRDASCVLAGVTVICVGVTTLRLGPFWELISSYDLSPEAVSGILALFVVDCGLVLLPLTVMATQQRMSAARATAQSQTFERLVAAATSTAVIATSRAGRIEVFNPGAEAIFGWSAQEMVGELPDLFHPPEVLAAHAQELRCTPTFADIARASVVRGEGSRLWEVVRRDGERRTLRLTLVGVRDGFGAVTGYLVTGEDVTEREVAHHLLAQSLEHERQAVERLREIERVKDEFVSTVSHELRTPITSIVGYTELLDEGAYGELTTGQREAIERVDRNGQRLLALVEDLLQLSQAERPDETVVMISNDARAAVSRAREALTTHLSRRHLSVHVLVPSSPVVWQGDAELLERMVLNLLTNAVKFTPDGGSIELRLDCAAEDRLRITVKDTGLGIPRDEQQQLFTRFFRSSVATERAIQGTGLGLAIVKAVVEQHDGTIEVSSDVGRGTTFTVELPRKPDALPVWMSGHEAQGA